MASRSHLLRRLVSSSAAEDRVTEVLAELLHEPMLRAAYLALVGVGFATERLRISTQEANIDGGGYPDMTLTDDDSVRVVIENKLGAAFTDHQPAEYHRGLVRWRSLDDRRHALLLIQVPAARLDSICRETWARLGRSDLGACRGAEIEGVQVIVTSWQQVAAALAPVAVDDSVVRYLRDGFVVLVHDDIGKGGSLLPMKLTETRVTMLRDPEVHAALLGLEDAQSSLRAALVARGETITDSWGAGYVYANPGSGRKDWIGSSFRAAVVFGTPWPLFMGVKPASEAVRAALQRAGMAVYDSTRLPNWTAWWLVPLRLEAGLDAAQQGQHLLKQLDEVRVAANGGARP